ncbi:unnamed protein product [Prorocentrum cordatum]|uniref:Uncharacterized protein n=1 Tax=Prorocentrum cordatum TaxID=2364126 RepID=A0ABN9UYU4_9DINO|nr:unnamed protein product [Polarella glacialis]
MSVLFAFALFLVVDSKVIVEHNASAAFGQERLTTSRSPSSSTAVIGVLRCQRLGVRGPRAHVPTRLASRPHLRLSWLAFLLYFFGFGQDVALDSVAFPAPLSLPGVVMVDLPPGLRGASDAPELKYLLKSKVTDKIVTTVGVATVTTNNKAPFVSSATWAYRCLYIVFMLLCLSGRPPGTLFHAMQVARQFRQYAMQSAAIFT